MYSLDLITSNSRGLFQLELRIAGRHLNRVYGNMFSGMYSTVCMRERLYGRLSSRDNIREGGEECIFEPKGSISARAFKSPCSSSYIQTNLLKYVHYGVGLPFQTLEIPVYLAMG